MVEAVISKINVDKNELAAQFKVRSIPTIFYFKTGNVGQNGFKVNQ
jgi:thioredoxin 1